MVLEKGSVYLQKSAILYHAIYRCVVIQRRRYIDTPKMSIVPSLMSYIWDIVKNWRIKFGESPVICQSQSFPLPNICAIQYIIAFDNLKDFKNVFSDGRIKWIIKKISFHYTYRNDYLWIMWSLCEVVSVCDHPSMHPYQHIHNCFWKSLAFLQMIYRQKVTKDKRKHHGEVHKYSPEKLCCKMNGSMCLEHGRQHEILKI